MHLIRSRMFLTGIILVGWVCTVFSTSQGGLITELSSQFQLTNFEPTQADEPQVTDRDFFHSETAELASQTSHGSDDPWIQIARSIDETGHAAQFGTMLVGTALDASRPQSRRRGAGGSGGGGSGSGGAGAASPFAGVTPTPTNPGGVADGVTPLEGPATVPASDPVSIPSVQPLIAEPTFPESQSGISVVSPPVQGPDLPLEPTVIPGGDLSDPGTAPVTPATGPRENPFIVPVLYENPEPASMVLLAIGAAALIFFRASWRETRTRSSSNAMNRLDRP